MSALLTIQGLLALFWKALPFIAPVIALFWGRHQGRKKATREAQIEQAEMRAALAEQRATVVNSVVKTERDMAEQVSTLADRQDEQLEAEIKETARSGHRRGLDNKW